MDSRDWQYYGLWTDLESGILAHKLEVLADQVARGNVPISALAVDKAGAATQRMVELCVILIEALRLKMLPPAATAPPQLESAGAPDAS